MCKKIKEFFKKRRKLFISCCILFSMLFIVGAVIGVYAVKVYYIKLIGIKISPSKDYAIHDVTYYLQNDPEWGDDEIGSSGKKMYNTGCLISCVASAMTDLGVSITPKELNAKMTENNGYQGADLIWYKLNELFEEIDYKYERIFSRKTIEADLEAGLLPIINVRVNGTGVTHWLLVVGAEDGEFIVYDPLIQEKEPIKLSVHGKVYAYRALIKAQ